MLVCVSAACPSFARATLSALRTEVTRSCRGVASLSAVLFSSTLLATSSTNLLLGISFSKTAAAVSSSLKAPASFQRSDCHPEELSHDDPEDSQDHFPYRHGIGSDEP